MKSDETQWMITGRKLDKTGRKSAQMKQKPVIGEIQMQTLFFYYLIRLDQPQAYVLLI